MSDSQESVEIRPGVGIFSLLPHMNYKPWYALGEFVDNSIQSYLQHEKELQALYNGKFKLRIDISVSPGDDPRIVIEDNAAGIYTKDVYRAFTPAMPPLDKSGISQYGIGMKSAATWYSRFFTISSAALGEDFRRMVTFDIGNITENEINELPIEKESKKQSDHGTRIVLCELNQGIPAGGTLGRVRSYLSSIYRDYIRSGEVIITVADLVLEYHNPPLLSAPFWVKNATPPAKDAPKVTWKKEIEITLDDSWKNDTAPNKGDKPPVITGWAGILEKGSTKTAGFALFWRSKVVMGAGSMSTDTNVDVFKPGNIFGASNSFPYQRIIGELNLSTLPVTAFKDQIAWREGQEEEFLEKLRKVLDSEPKRLIEMASNYRSTERSRPIQDTVNKTATSTAGALERELTKILESGQSPFALTAESPEEPQPTTPMLSPTAIAIIKLPSDIESDITLEIKDQPDDPKWLRIEPVENKWRIVINRAHPFMNSFASLPGADLEPVLRLGIAIGFAEIRARTSGSTEPSALRREINELLRGELSTRMQVQNVENDE